jgi:hypothetical protein
LFRTILFRDFNYLTQVRQFIHKRNVVNVRENLCARSTARQQAPTSRPPASNGNKSIAGGGNEDQWKQSGVLEECVAFGGIVRRNRRGFDVGGTGTGALLA